MNLLNVEIKARCSDPGRIRTLLAEHGADFKGTDHQVDTYFQVPGGRLKLRQGNIEQNLIFYRRPDSRTPKTSGINLVPAEHPEELHALLSNALGVLAVVDKKREIYFIDTVKFHIDEVQKLGHFLEIEAIDSNKSRSEAQLKEQCQSYIKILDIAQEDLVAQSYSDLLLAEESIS